METITRNDSYPKADIQLWGKGYRISADSEEFQRYLPKDPTELKGLDRKTQTIPWASLLESLYPLREAEVAAQRCVLFDTSDLLSVSFAKTEDRHRRPSLVLTTCTVGIDWRNPQLGEIAARAIALSSRLATTYAETLKGNPENVGKQLRDNSFLTSRSFDLGEEHPDQAADWAHAISAVKKWNGIMGISTPRLLVLGANVVLGTKYEAERAKQQFQVDGFFDARDRDIKVLSDRLRLWEPEPQAANPPSEEERQTHSPSSVDPSQGKPAHQHSPELYWVAECLQRLTNSVDRLVDVAAEILERVTPEKRKK
jgi:hypothetical protein